MTSPWLVAAGPRHAEERLYDEMVGPRSPRALTRRPRPREWDDPTWLPIAIDDDWMNQRGIIE